MTAAKGQRNQAIRKTSASLDVTIIGPGNWGTSLASALTAVRIPLREIVVRKRPQKKSGGKTPRLPYKNVVLWPDAVLDARILWLCVPDAAVAETAEQIVTRRSDLRGQIVVHSSGALTAGLLEPARAAGAQIASIHPVMSFPTREIVNLDGVLFGVETRDPATRRTLHSLVRKLGGRPFDLPAGKKSLYHAAGTLASPLLVSELSAAIETARLAGLDRHTASLWVQSLVEATVTNVFTKGTARSFSGPFARGDARTIDLHLQALGAHPILADVYRSLARHAIQVLPVKNVRMLKEILGEPVLSATNHSRDVGNPRRRRRRVRD
jgi:predicted short-subunit dehydrogenase-like oxidoreductase (DUF2520 family)